MKKQLVIVGTVVLLLAVGFSGCLETELSVEIDGPLTGLVNELLTFQDNASGGTQPYTFLWDLDNDGKYDDSNNETAVFTTIYGGTYMIKVRVTDKNGKQKEAGTTLILPLTPWNIIIKNVTFSPSHPVANENITFNVLVENTGDITIPQTGLFLNWTTQAGKYGYYFSEDFSLAGHSQKNITLSTGENLTDEGMQSFNISYYDYIQWGTNRPIIIKIVDIQIQPAPPEIYLATTASKVVTFGEYTEKTTFEAGDKAYVYYEYTNVNHEDIIDTYHTISVHHKESWVRYYSNTYDGKKVSNSERWSKWWSFNTYDWYDGNWPKGRYQVDIGLLDEITQKTTTSKIYFTLI